MKKIICFFLFTCCAWFVQADSVDSLKNLLLKDAMDTTRVIHLNQLAKLYFNIDNDSILQYGLAAKSAAEKINYKRGLAYANKYIGMSYYRKADYLVATNYWKTSFAIFKEIGDKVGQSNMLNNIGVLYFEQGVPSKASEYYFQSLKLALAMNDTLRIVTAYLNIGTIYSDFSKDFKTAISYQQKALPLAIGLGDIDALISLYGNVGENYIRLHEDSTALIYLSQVLKYDEKFESKSYALIELAEAYNNLNLPEEALKYIN